ncbi:hypothetical protein Ga0074812_10841 [Parafrankia irregularis]|uniref:Uncharacterized protein n=1 Tax=Parafrankia irregularis TaxID=795642 RepID=A0A0S4QLN7_9ACTN|nr:MULTISPECIES: hypothetical protein [Parafrankia]MBE3205314.1 hypothetical protein [Parafrankia sp. CH37]CUU56513.1 hypothetical protein Ga0074812_10841 [Parafrankia irregularis]
METTALGFLYGPTLVLLTIGVLVFICRLTSGSAPRGRAGSPRNGSARPRSPRDGTSRHSGRRRRGPQRGHPRNRASRAGRAWPGARQPQDFGLLVPVATGPKERAAQVRAVLAAGGVRATLGPAGTVRARHGRPVELAHVLVFANDVPSALRTLRQARGAPGQRPDRGPDGGGPGSGSAGKPGGGGGTNR